MSYWSQPLRVETPEYACLNTSRTINSGLWFVNNKKLEGHTMGYLAKYQEKYEVELYAYNQQGSHDHSVARFPGGNRSEFTRDFKARIAEGVRKYVAEFLGGPLFEGRYSSQILPNDADIEEYFFYCALQPVHAGLCERISDYPGYNSFHDAIWGIKRKYKLVNWGRYNAAKRYNLKVRPEDFSQEHTLSYSRLPGYEQLSQREYAHLMLSKLEQRRAKVVAEWKAKGHRFMSKAQLRKVVPGSLPHKRKQGILRPIVLSSCVESKRRFLEWYFGLVRWYREASKRYRAGELDVVFPPFTYRPLGGLVLPP